MLLESRHETEFILLPNSCACSILVQFDFSIRLGMSQSDRSLHAFSTTISEFLAHVSQMVLQEARRPLLNVWKRQESTNFAPPNSRFLAEQPIVRWVLSPAHGYFVGHQHELLVFHEAHRLGARFQPSCIPMCFEVVGSRKFEHVEHPGNRLLDG